MIAACIAVAISAIGIAQAAAAWLVVRRFAARLGTKVGPATVPVTILKPLHGDEPLLEQALSTVCAQDYPTWQVVFGVQDPTDTALPVVRRLQARYPNCDIAIVVDPTPHGPNRKVANLINMLPAAKHDVLVIADSDMHVAPDWLRHVVAALEEAPSSPSAMAGGPSPPSWPGVARPSTSSLDSEAPRVGLVTTLYVGLPVAGNRTAASLGILQINHYFLPGALLARALGRQDCLGATMMLRRDTLNRIGGLPALVNHLADDNVLGRLVQRLGLTVALADTIPATTVPETTLPALWRHELRWARTIRALAPLPFAASVLQYPIAWAALAVLLAGATPVFLAWFALAWALRALAARETDKALALATAPRSGFCPSASLCRWRSWP
jgi:ceramide glucosyltransferase